MPTPEVEKLELHCHPEARGFLRAEGSLHLLTPPTLPARVQILRVAQDDKISNFNSRKSARSKHFQPGGN